jgi:hypothetical protein
MNVVGRAGIADLKHTLREIDRTLQHGVDHEPGLIEVQVLELDARLLARDAARAVAAEDPARLDGARLLRGEIPNGQLHAVVVLDDVGHLVAQVDRHGRQALRAGTEGALQVRLVEHEARRPAILRRPFGSTQAEERGACAGYEIHAGDR